MYGLTRAPITLIASGAAGLLVWLATQLSQHTNAGFWAAHGLLAGAGLVMALSQLIGGWTKWGVPRISPHVLFVAFLPAAVCVGWLLVAGQPRGSTTQSHVIGWSGDIGIRGLVTDLMRYLGVLAFGLGLLFGLSFDTTGPAIAKAEPRDWTAVREAPTTVTPAPVAPVAPPEPEPAPETEPTAVTPSSERAVPE